MCGNEGIDDEMIEWLRDRIRAVNEYVKPNIVPHDKKYFSKMSPEKKTP